MHRLASIIIVLFLLCLVNQPVVADKKSEFGPEFEEYLAEIDARLPSSAPVDLSSHPWARSFRTRLRNVAAEGANFAGHYALVNWGCGTECQGSLLVDVRTGKVVGLKGSDEPLATARGVAFRIDSRLLIADPPCPEPGHRCGCLSMGQYLKPVRYYVIEEGGLRLLKIRDQNCGAYEGMHRNPDSRG